MDWLFGLSRDPFAPVCDGDLYWENPRRGVVREEVSRLLRKGKGVWLHGEAGAGREALLGKVAEDVVSAGRPVIWAGSETPADEQALFELLLDAAGVGPIEGSLTDRAAILYRTTLEGFSRAGPVVIFLEATLGERALRELQILAGLHVAGKPLVALALWGEGEAPLECLASVGLPSLSSSDLGACIVHRSAACGRPDLLSCASIEAVVSEARGVGDAVRRARRAVLRMAFSGHQPADGRNASGASAQPVLDPEELGEVDQILGDLEPRFGGPQKL